MLHNHVQYNLSALDLRMVRAIPPGGNWKNIPVSIPSKRLEKIRSTGGRTTLYGRLDWQRPSYTITTYFHRPGNGTYIHPDHDRVITAREAARLQSFPDSYIFSGSKGSMCVQIGNAVPPVMAFAVAESLKRKTNTKTVVDLFCGAGGLSWGFQEAGFEVLAANDNLHEACETFRLNHKDTALIEGDITVPAIKTLLYDTIGKNKIDIVVGGPPCQGFSYAGKRFINDPRNFLFKEYINVVKKLNPKIIVMENVEGILTSNGGKTFAGIQEEFKKLGYKTEARKLHAVMFGVPQKRKRIILIGVKKGNPADLFPETLLRDEKNYITVNDAIGDLKKITPITDPTGSVQLKTTPKTLFQQFVRGIISPHTYINSVRD